MKCWYVMIRLVIEAVCLSVTKLLFPSELSAAGCRRKSDLISTTDFYSAFVCKYHHITLEIFVEHFSQIFLQIVKKIFLKVFRKSCDTLGKTIILWQLWHEKGRAFISPHHASCCECYVFRTALWYFWMPDCTYLKIYPENLLIHKAQEIKTFIGLNWGV